MKSKNIITNETSESDNDELSEYSEEFYDEFFGDEVLPDDWSEGLLDEDFDDEDIF